MAINRATGPAKPGTHYVGAHGELAVVTHLIDKRGCDVQDPAQAVTAVIYDGSGWLSIALRPRDRKRIFLAAGSA
jgi:hypothetical protein